MPQSKIKLFWDLESCPPPHLYSGSPWDLLKAIRLFTFRFGIVSSFKAYGDRSQRAGRSNVSLEALMPSMGISLIDCSLVQEYDRDALSRTLAAEVLVSAIDDPIDLDGPEPDIIMIFSGDKGILHPISLLMLRGYTIYLVVPDQAEKVESSRATRVFSWNADVLNLNHSRSPSSVHGTTMDQSSSIGSSAAGSRKGGLKRLPETTSREPVADFKSPASFSSDLGVSDPRVQSKSPKVTSRGQSTAQEPSGGTQMTPDIFKTSTIGLSTPKTKSIPIPALLDLSGSRAPSALSLGSGTQIPNFDTLSKGNTKADSKPPVNTGSLVGTRPVEEPKSTINDWGMNNGWNESGGWGMGSSSWLGEPSKPPKSAEEEVIATTGMAIAQFDLEPFTLSDLPPHVDSSHAEELTVNTSVFLPLLECLHRARAEGKVQVLRSVVGGELSKDKSIYQTAGVKDFKTYIALAVEVGLVTLGGIAGQAWVALK